jgi:hypothetical protein
MSKMCGVRWKDVSAYSTHVCPHTSVYICPQTSLYVSSYLYVSVRIPLDMCHHASLYMSAYLFIYILIPLCKCPHTSLHSRRKEIVEIVEFAGRCGSGRMRTYADVC